MQKLAGLCVLLAALFLFTLAGCGPFGIPGGHSPKAASKPLQDFYPGDISRVDKIEIINGVGHKVKTVTDAPTIRAWIREIRGIALTIDPNQEPRTGGDRYLVHLYERGAKKLSISTDGIGATYILPSKPLVDQIDALYRKVP